MQTCLALQATAGAFKMAYCVDDTCIQVLTQMQVWKSFRQESYARHKVIGRIVMASLLGSHITAATIAYRHILSDQWSEKVCLPQRNTEIWLQHRDLVAGMQSLLQTAAAPSQTVLLPFAAGYWLWLCNEHCSFHV